MELRAQGYIYIFFPYVSNKISMFLIDILKI